MTAPLEAREEGVEEEEVSEAAVASPGRRERRWRWPPARSVNAGRGGNITPLELHPSCEWGRETALLLPARVEMVEMVARRSCMCSWLTPQSLHACCARCARCARCACRPL